LWEVGEVRDEVVLLAALLHDTVEDTDTTIAEIAEQFGSDVAGVVAEVTDDKSLAKADRKRLQVTQAAKKSPRARLVKLADKISNVCDLRDSPPHDWSPERRREYLEWTREVVGGMRSTSPALERLFDLSCESALARLV
jgi:guanosine-3',5'-bis(diphosphate) 3'-pyrophosphohydrolase